MRLLLLSCVSLALTVVPVADGFSPPTSQPLRSPDGKWSVRYTRRQLWGRLTLTDIASRHSTSMYRSNDSCCDDITWVKPHLLVFVDDYNVKTLDPATEHVRRIAGFSDFVLSPDSNWIAGYADSGGHGPETVDLVRPTGGPCRAVPHTAAEDDSLPVFSRDSTAVRVIRRHFNRKLGYDTGPSRQISFPLASLRRVSSC